MAQCRWAGGRSWVDLPTTGWAGVDRARAVALLPVAAVEQHGSIGLDVKVILTSPCIFY